MPDITMCGGVGCPFKHKCYRYTATPDPYRQSYFVVSPYKYTNNTCDHFTPNEEDKS